MALAPQKTRGFILVVSMGAKRPAKLMVPEEAPIVCAYSQGETSASVADGWRQGVYRPNTSTPIAPSVASQARFMPWLL